jgi:hypothetical protein
MKLYAEDIAKAIACHGYPIPPIPPPMPISNIIICIAAISGILSPPPQPQPSSLSTFSSLVSFVLRHHLLVDGNFQQSR